MKAKYLIPCACWFAVGCSESPTPAEADPLFAMSPAADITAEQIEGWSSAPPTANDAESEGGSSVDGGGSMDGADAAVDAGAPQPTETAGLDFSDSPSAGITEAQLAEWNDAAQWGDHGEAGYLSQELDPLFAASPAAAISAQQITTWDSLMAGTGGAEADPVFGSSVAASLAPADLVRWNAAYGWGDHAAQGYLQSEDDPTFAAAAASSITTNNLSNWNAAYGWGDHAAQGYLSEAPGLADVLATSPSAGGSRIQQLAEPVEDSDAVTKAYADALLGNASTGDALLFCCGRDCDDALDPQWQCRTAPDSMAIPHGTGGEVIQVWASWIDIEEAASSEEIFRCYEPIRLCVAPKREFYTTCSAEGATPYELPGYTCEEMPYAAVVPPNSGGAYRFSPNSTSGSERLQHILPAGPNTIVCPHDSTPVQWACWN